MFVIDGKEITLDNAKQKTKAKSKKKIVKDKSIKKIKEQAVKGYCNIVEDINPTLK